jgi:hypothetical protein
VHNWCRPCAFHTVWVNFAQMGSSPITQNAHQSQRLTLAGRDEREQDEAQIDASLKNGQRAIMADLYLPTWVNEHKELIIYLALTCFLIAHWRGWFRHASVGFLALFALLVIVSVLGFIGIIIEESVPISFMYLFMAVFGVSLYIILCEMFQRGVAQRLTETRGEKWVKELDYCYLLVAVGGIIVSVNRIDKFTGRFSKGDIPATVVLITAVVIRLIKTRAEIHGWNKPHASTRAVHWVAERMSQANKPEVA